MPPFKPPTFQERAKLSAKAKQAAVEALRAKTPVDEHTLAEKRSAKAARDAAETQRRDEKRAAWEGQRAARRARADERRELEAMIPVLTDAERKAAHDARYARRKNRSDKA